MADNIQVGLELKDNMSSALGTVAKAISSFSTKVDSGLTKVSEALADVEAAMRGMATTAQSAMPKTAAATSKAAAETLTEAEKLRRSLKIINDAAGQPIVIGNINYAGVDKLKGKLDELYKSIVQVNTKSSNALAGSIISAQGVPKVDPKGFEQAVNFGAIQSEAIALLQKVDDVKASLYGAMEAAKGGSTEAASRVAFLTAQMRGLEEQSNNVNASYAAGVAQLKQLTANANSQLTNILGKGAKPIEIKDLFPTQAQSQLDALQARIRSITEQRIEIAAIKNTFQNFGEVFPFLNKQVDATDSHILRMVNNLPRMRYALYDISRNATITGAALVGAFGLAAGAAINYDRKFADVRRTTGLTGEAAANLKQEFIALKQALPVSFGQLTEIGTLAGQLDIATESVASFTKTVAMFSATTDVNVSDAATAFGRLDKLVYGVNGQFEKLGSSILAVGTSAVATEGQIIRVSQQIASIANLAGFSSDQIIGFSSALASVGISPELARGLVTRTFSAINTAAAAGGEQLARFGRVANMSGAEFAQAWRSDASGAFVTFLKGINEDGATAEQTLRELGITSIRDIPSLLKLAQGHEEVARQLGIAAEGFALGTELQKQYDVITSTVAEKIKVLTGNFEVLTATVGGSANGFGAVIDIGIGLLKFLTELANNPFGSALAGISGSILLVGGGISLLTGGITKLIAGLAAGVTGSISWRTTLGLMKLDSVSLGAAQETVALTTAQKAAALELDRIAMMKSTGQSVALTTQLQAQLAALRANIAAMSVMQKVTAAAGYVGIAIAALSALSLAWQAVADANKTAQQVAKEYYGDFTAVIEAAKVDTADLANGLQSQSSVWMEVSVASNSAAKNITDSALAAHEAAGGSEALTQAIRDTTDAINSQNLAFGENAKAALRKIVTDKVLSDSENPLVKIFDSPALKQALAQNEVDIQQFSDSILFGKGEYAQKVIDNLLAVAAAGTTVIGSGENAKVTMTDEASAANDLANQLSIFKTNTEGASGATLAQAEALQSLTGATTEVEDATASLNSQFFESEKLAINEASSLFDLGKALAENGNGFNILTEAGRANQDAMIAAMTAISDNAGSPLQAAANLQALYDMMLAAGVPASQMIMLSNAISSLSGGKALPAANINLASFNAGLKKTSSSAGGAAKKVRTLTDYASDLAKVFERAFDIRFSSISALDNITSQFSSITQTIADANDEITSINENINSLNADIQSLTADKALQEYFLTVAVAYGDTLKAQEIRANLAKIDADLAKKNSDLVKENKSLAKAQDKTNKTLVGNSDAAIDNRAEILDLVNGYQDYLKALAASGASQEVLRAKSEQLKQDFIAQATQLGYNQDELGLYAAAFDDVAVAVDNVPRDLTVTVDPNPALTALNEIKAAAEAAGGAIGGMDSQMPDFDTKPARKLALQAKIQYLTAYLATARQSSNWRAGDTILSELIVAQRALANGTYATGGYTGAGGKYEPAGIVHRGEYVVPKEQVNQATGLPYYMSQVPKFFNSGYVGNSAAPSPTSMIVELSPTDRALLAQAGNVQLAIDGRVIAGATNRGNLVSAQRGTN